MSLQPSQNFFNLVEEMEGLVLHPYTDKAGYPTIGYGSRFYPGGKAVTLEDKSITQEEAQSILTQNLKAFVDHLNFLAPGVNQNEFDALLDFEYNLGWGNLASSTLLKRVKADAPPTEITEAFMMWDEIKINGVLKVSDWQEHRRAAEAALYNKSVV